MNRTENQAKHMGKSLKKRFIVISIFVLPILLSISAVIGLYVCELILPNEVLKQGKPIIVLSLVPLYLLCVFIAYKAAKAKSEVW